MEGLKLDGPSEIRGGQSPRASAGYSFKPRRLREEIGRPGESERDYSREHKRIDVAEEHVDGGTDATQEERRRQRQEARAHKRDDYGARSNEFHSLYVTSADQRVQSMILYKEIFLSQEKNARLLRELKKQSGNVTSVPQDVKVRLDAILEKEHFRIRKDDHVAGNKICTRSCVKKN